MDLHEELVLGDGIISAILLGHKLLLNCYYFLLGPDSVFPFCWLSKLYQLEKNYLFMFRFLLIRSSSCNN